MRSSTDAPLLDADLSITDTEFDQIFYSPTRTRSNSILPTFSDRPITPVNDLNQILSPGRVYDCSPALNQLNLPLDMNKVHNLTPQLDVLNNLRRSERIVKRTDYHHLHHLGRTSSQNKNGENGEAERDRTAQH